MPSNWPPQQPQRPQRFQAEVALVAPARPDRRVEFTTDDYDAVRQIDDKWIAVTEGKRTARRQIVGRDRNNPSRYLALVYFDSHESAMQNSALPETQEFAGPYGGVTNSVAFHDLDIVSDQEL